MGARPRARDLPPPLAEDSAKPCGTQADSTTCARIDIYAGDIRHLQSGPGFVANTVG